MQEVFYIKFFLSKITQGQIAVLAKTLSHDRKEKTMQLYISDLDGTLLDRNAEITEYTKTALNRLIAKGMNFTVATARTYSSAGRILAGLDLQLPIVLMNGVLIYHPVRHEYEVINTLADADAERIISLCGEHGLSPFMYLMNGSVMSTAYSKLTNQAMKDFLDERVQKYGKAFIHTDNLTETEGDVIYFCFLDDYEKLAPMQKVLSGMPSLKTAFYHDIYGDEWYLEVFSAEASKESGVRYLREKYGFDKITAFGDNLNDLPMFAAADERIAVSNAAEELIKTSHRVIGANTEDGVAKYLEELYNG